MERWRPFGRPVLVGAAAYGLLAAPDIDLEVYCAEPRIEDGFAVLRACSLDPRVREARFANELNGPDQGLYWQIRYRHESGQVWKIDMWAVRHDHPGPTSLALVEPMKRVLTAETRQAILEIKEAILLDPGWKCPSIHVYRAVLDDGIRSLEGFRVWLDRHETDGLANWKPGAAHDA